MKVLLVTSAGGTVGRIILEMIRGALPPSTKIIAADSFADLTYVKDLADSAKLPIASDLKYARELCNLISKREIDAILPLSEEECLVISKLAEANLLGNACYLGMERNALEVVTNKLRCAEVLRNAGLAVPKYSRLNNFQTLGETLFDFGYPSIPVVIKPISARGSRGFRVISATTNRLSEMSRKGGPIFVDLEQIKEIFRDREDALNNYFLMEFLPGESLSVDIVAWRGFALGVFPHRRLGYRWGFVDQAEIFYDREVEAYARAVVECLDMHGMCNLELGNSAEGKLSLIEVNGRTSATAPQNRLVGANLFEMFLQAESGDLRPFQLSQRVKYRVFSQYRAL